MSAAQLPRSLGGLLTADRLGLRVAVILLVASAASWAATYKLMPLVAMSRAGMMGPASMVSSLSPAAIGIFELVWVIGMAAMMFPAMIPVVLFYNKVVTKVEPDPQFARVVGTPLVLVGYLAAYGGLGLLIYLAIFFAVSLPLGAALAGLAVIAPSAVLILAGVYQLSPLKSTCLTRCVSPLGFFSVHSHRGLLGSLRMGFAHGRYCVGCCWAYMLVMAAVAVMSLPFMAVLAGVITMEKVFARGAVWFTRAVAAGFVVLGVVSLLVPSVLGVLSAGL